MKKPYNIYYEWNGEGRHYCKNWMDLEQAEKVLDKFKKIYLLPNGCPRQFPNGKGFYPITRVYLTERNV